MLGSRGDSSTNVIIFLTVIIAAVILVLWYSQTVRPTRHIIGTVSEDMQEIGRHLANACVFDVYNGTYGFATPSGFFESNTTDFCIYTEVFGSCRPLPCSDINATRFALAEGLIVRVQRDHAPISLSLDS